MKYTVFLLFCLGMNTIYCQDNNSINLLESKHKLSSQIQTINIFWGDFTNIKGNNIIAYEENNKYSQAKGVIQGSCEDGIITNTAIVKINDNLIYTLTIGATKNEKDNQIRILLSKISDGETKDLINNVYSKERFKNGANRYLEIINFDTGKWGSNFYIIIEDYRTLRAFCLPDVSSSNDEDLRVFEISPNYNPCE